MEKDSSFNQDLPKGDEVNASEIRIKRVYGHFNIKDIEKEAFHEQEFMENIFEKKKNPLRNVRKLKNFHNEHQKKIPVDNSETQSLSSGQSRPMGAHQTGLKPKVFDCQYCHKKFTTRPVRDCHEKWHLGDRDFKCQFCPKRFFYPSSRRYHEKSHTAEKHFQCRFCPMKFFYKLEKQMHETRDHIERPTKINKKTHEGINKNHCQFCRKKLATKGWKTRHEKQCKQDKSNS